MTDSERDDVKAVLRMMRGGLLEGSAEDQAEVSSAEKEVLEIGRRSDNSKVGVMIAYMQLMLEE